MRLESAVLNVKGKPFRAWRISRTKRFWGPWCRSRITATLAWVFAGTRFSCGWLWNWIVRLDRNEEGEDKVKECEHV